MSSTRGSITTTGTVLQLSSLFPNSCFANLSEEKWFGIFLLQLVRRCILESILESEKNYLDSLKRILEV